MKKPVEICTFELDVLLVDKEGQHLPNPMITVVVDSATRAIIRVNISTGNSRGSNSNAEL